MLALREGPDAPAQFVFDHGQLGGAPGRFAFGLGTSSNVIVEKWNGIAFDEPYTHRGSQENLLGKNADAINYYQRLTRESAQSAYGNDARARLAALSPTP